MVHIFIGFDPREAVAYNVLTYSIVRRSSIPVAITPIVLAQNEKIFKRPRDPLQSTDFSFSRFLTPYLSKYEGWSLFLDCDMLMLDDVAKLWALRDERYAVQVVKHEYAPPQGVKFLGEKQTPYAKKNWSSVMLFNNKRCRTLSPAYVEHASGLDLHQFKWLASDDEIGALPAGWNFLVGHDHRQNHVSLVHFTVGGPYFKQYADCEFSEEWRAERDAMLYAATK